MGAWHQLNLSIFKKVLSVGSGKLSSELNKKVEEINSKEQELEQLTDIDIKNRFHELKKRLKDETSAAIDVGVFGSPYFIIDGEAFWGADRLWMIKRWLQTGGW